MSDVVERFLVLGLRLGRHVDGFVDAYYGPEELATKVADEELGSPEELVGDADALLRDLDASELESHRREWIGDQIRGVRVAAGVLAGESVSYSDEVEGCYGVRPDAWSEDAYREVHERLDELLPPGDSLLDRFEGWRESRAVPVAKMVPAFRAVVDVLRTRVAASRRPTAGRRASSSRRFTTSPGGRSITTSGNSAAASSSTPTR